MSSSVVGKVVFIIGLLLLLNAGYSAVQHRTYLKLAEEPFTSLPMELSVQTFFALALTLAGNVAMSADFKSLSDRSTLTTQYLDNRPGFATFRHRGRVMASK
eukprot:CFRG5468T1